MRRLNKYPVFSDKFWTNEQRVRPKSQNVEAFVPKSDWRMGPWEPLPSALRPGGPLPGQGCPRSASWPRAGLQRGGDCGAESGPVLPMAESEGPERRCVWAKVPSRKSGTEKKVAFNKLN